MTTTISNTSHDDYQPMLEAVRAQFAGVTGPLFTTTATGRDLWDEWMDDMPEHEKKQHDCHACRRFVETYGGLVRIDEQGVAPGKMTPSELGAFIRSETVKWTKTAQDAGITAE